MGNTAADSDLGATPGFTKLRRRFVQLSEQSSDRADNLRVLQFNTLADGLAQNGDFIAVPAEVLQWSNRAAPLLEEILEAEADLIALQEVNHYDDFLRPELEARGYRGAFIAKCTSPAASYGYGADGCALFWRDSRLQLVAGPEPTCFRTAAGEEESQGVLQLRLRDRRTGAHLVVGTTHLKAKSGAKNEAIRQRQAQQTVDRLAESVAQQSQPSDSKAEPLDRGSSNGATAAAAAPPAVLLCGDFNAEPQSAELQVVAQHPLGLQSLWDARLHNGRSVGGEVEERLFTTWKIRTEGQTQRVIDYVWYTRLQPVRRWLTPTVEEIGPAALPCRSYPSDHVAVCCEFRVS